MELDEFLNVCVSSKGINNYLSMRIDNSESLSSKEYDAINIFFNNLINQFPNDINRISSKIKKLIIISKNNKKDVNKYFDLNKENIKTFSKKEVSEYLQILVKSRVGSIFDHDIKMAVYRYLSFDDNETLRDFLRKNVNSDFYNELETIIKNNYNDFLSNIYSELIKKDICIENLEKSINMFCNLENKCEFCYLNLTLVKRVVESVNDEKLNNKILLLGQFTNLKYKFLQKLYSLMDNDIKNNFIKNEIENGKIIIRKRFSNKLVHHANVQFDDLPIVHGENIISIDDISSPEIDVAFSISKVYDTYVFNVYVSDVPSFLVKNKEIMEEAYKRGNSMYIRLPENNLNINMIPSTYSHKYLSLNKGHTKNVIDFSFVFDEEGNMLSSGVKRVRIKVNQAYTQTDAKFVFDVNQDFITYKEMAKKVCEKSNDYHFKNINLSCVDGLNSFASILVNYYIGYKADFAIYRNNGIYTCEKNGYYTNSVSPLRKFVSDINLMFFLSQIGEVNYPDKYLYMITDNIDEVINHLNETSMISSFVSSNSAFVKKYMRNY